MLGAIGAGRASDKLREENITRLAADRRPRRTTRSELGLAVASATGRGLTELRATRLPARRRRNGSAQRDRRRFVKSAGGRIVLTDPRTDVAPGIPEAAIRVQDVDVQCVLQFTLIHAAGCALHRRTSRVIHRLELCFSHRGFRRQESVRLAAVCAGRRRAQCECARARLAAPYRPYVCKT